MTKAAVFTLLVFLLFIITASLHCGSISVEEDNGPPVPVALPISDKAGDANSTGNYLTRALQQALKNLLKSEYNCTHTDKIVRSESVEEGKPPYTVDRFKCTQTNIQIYAVFYALFAVAITALWTTTSFLAILAFIKLYEVYLTRCRCHVRLTP